MPSGSIFAIAAVAAMLIYGAGEVGRAAKKGFHETVCLVKTGHHCKKPAK